MASKFTSVAEVRAEIARLRTEFVGSYSHLHEVLQAAIDEIRAEAVAKRIVALEQEMRLLAKEAR